MWFSIVSAETKTFAQVLAELVSNKDLNAATHTSQSPFQLPRGGCLPQAWQISKPNHKTEFHLHEPTS
jgi:hypothetical protein